MEKKEWWILFWIAAVFGIFYFVPYGSEWFNSSLISASNLLSEYAKQHVLTCLIPALFIAGSIAAFLRKDKIIRLLGSSAKKYVSYPVAAVSGAILAVCSCTILPLFAGIRSKGAGLGPAVTLLFSGPAINIAAMFLTISVLGVKIGAARIIASIVISIIVGITMALIFREKAEDGSLAFEEEKGKKIGNKILALFFILLVSTLIINGLQIQKQFKYLLMIALAAAALLLAFFKFGKETSKEWFSETWNFAKLIMPLLFIGIFVAGFIMPLIPQEFIEKFVGQNSIVGNLIASLFGAFMYFSTLTEIPIVQALVSKGMNEGPALALLLAGPSLSLPSMLVIRKVMGTAKTLAYVALVIVYSAAAGFVFGLI